MTSSRSPAATTPSAVRTPRRIARAATTSANLTPLARKRRSDEENHTAPLSAATSHRRISSASEELRRPATRFTTRLSSAHNAEPTRRRGEERGLPDRGTVSILQPSPTAKRTPTDTTRVQRPALKASPYARRTSAGGSGRISTASVTRKLNMAPVEEMEESPARRRTALPSPAARRLSGARDISSRSQERYRTDRVERDQKDRLERRRESGSKRMGQNALESFRAVRRASLESNEAAEKEGEMQIDMQPMHMEPAQDGESMQRETVTAVQPVQIGNLSMDDTESETPREEPLPDRPDPTTPSGKIPTSKTAAKSRRTSERFSEANICLDNVDKLRLSLGRRRSRGINEDMSHIETPKLRRTSLGKGNFFVRPEMEQGADQMMDDMPEEPNYGLYGVARSPLRSIETNRENVNSALITNSVFGKMGNNTEISRHFSNTPGLDDDEAWANEDVEDLGAW